MPFARARKIQKIPMKIFIAPHNDDEALFGTFTLMRERPLVILVTDSYVQGLRPGVNITKEQRRKETIKAMKLIGCQVAFLGIPDTEVTLEKVRSALMPYRHAKKVYAPALQSGHLHHDIVHDAVEQIWKEADIAWYSTYARGKHFTPLGEPVEPTEAEQAMKERVLACYTSQLNYAPTRPHFDATVGQPEYLS